MTSGKRTSSETAEAASARRRRRPTPTIDLTATEVENAAAGARGQAPPAAADAGVDRKPWAWLQAHLDWPHVGAGMAGGVLVALVLFALWLTGAVPIRYAGTTAMRARVSVLEMQLHELQNRQPPVIDSKSLEELSQRLAKIEQAAAAPRPPVNDPALMERLAAAETAMQSLGIALTALNRGAGDTAANAAEAKSQAAAVAKAVTELQNATRAVSPGIERGDLDALAKRIAALEQVAKTAEMESAKAAGAPDNVARLALSVAALRSAVSDGQPYAAEFATVKSLGGDPGALAFLEPFAGTGLPSEAALTRELSALVPELLKASGVNAPLESGFLDRLQANAGKLVRVRPAGDVPGDDAVAAVVARIEIKAAQADIAGALVELNKLPASLRAPAGGWTGRLAARNAALAASRKLSTDTLRLFAR